MPLRYTLKCLILYYVNFTSIKIIFFNDSSFGWNGEKQAGRSGTPFLEVFDLIGLAEIQRGSDEPAVQGEMGWRRQLRSHGTGRDFKCWCRLRSSRQRMWERGNEGPHEQALGPQSGSLETRSLFAQEGRAVGRGTPRVCVCKTKRVTAKIGLDQISIYRGLFNKL